MPRAGSPGRRASALRPRRAHRKHRAPGGAGRPMPITESTPASAPRHPLGLSHSARRGAGSGSRSGRLRQASAPHAKSLAARLTWLDDRLSAELARITASAPGGDACWSSPPRPGSAAGGAANIQGLAVKRRLMTEFLGNIGSSYRPGWTTWARWRIPALGRALIVGAKASRSIRGEIEKAVEDPTPSIKFQNA